MKKYLIPVFITLFFSASVMANFFDHTVSDKTEELVLEKVEVAIPKILSGKIRSVFQGSECWPNNSKTIKVLSVMVDKAYTLGTDGKLVPYFTGTINYSHSSCRDNN